eukprot:COSAG01_NODE_1187_length_11337_cov_185.267574_4_plen_54_part_00
MNAAMVALWLLAHAPSQVTDVGVFSFDTKPNAKSPPGSSLPHTLVPLPSPPFL